MADFTIYSVTLFLGAFGATSQKPLILFSNKAWIEDLHVPIPPGTVFEPDEPVVRHYQNAYGEDCVVGGQALHDTQTYPPRFGHHVAETFSLHRPEPQGHQYYASHAQDVGDIRSALRMGPDDDPWDDAELMEVMDYLRGV